MKKVLMCIICLLLILTVSACSTIDLQSNNISSALSSEKGVTLIRALRGTDDISVIKSLSIIYEYGTDKTVITDSNDWTFLEKYTYSHIYPTEELSVLFTFPGTNIIQIDDVGEQLYLMKDGSIVKREMCGDSEVDNISYEVYKAEENYMLNEQRLVVLLGKYNKDELNFEVTSKEQETSSTGPTICPPRPFDYSDQEKVNETVKDIMDYKKIIQGNNHGILSVDELKSQTLENQYGFVLKIRVTNKYKNVLEYEMSPDVNDLLSGYENVEIDNNGYPTSKAIASTSYLLTNVIVEEIYYSGDALNINKGDNVEIAELCYIAAQSSPYVIQQNESEPVLFCQEDMVKLEPNKEYIIFGYKNNDKESSKYGHLQTVGFQEGIYQVDKEKEKSFYQNSNKDLVINECISKLESLQKENNLK